MDRSPAAKSYSMRLNGRLLAGLIRLVKQTSRTVYEPRDLDELLRAHRPFILAMWHGQFMMLADLYAPDVAVSAMVSRHGDGELVAATLQRFGIGLIRGAGAGRRKRNRGGAYAMRTALKTLDAGTVVAMTADVPLGEVRTCGAGIVTLARHSGRPIIPVAAATSRFLTLRTWSRMTINLPFSTLAYVAGDPLFVAAHADEHALEQARQDVERSLNAATARAYALAGTDWTRTAPTGMRRKAPRRYQ
jgi:lysophospholipid acyltransferase (LPLAT)-like uncharacterized protein